MGTETTDFAHRRSVALAVTGVVFALATAVSLGACTGQTDDGAAATTHEHESSDHEQAPGDHEHATGDHLHALGEPGDPAESTRTIELAASDAMRFEPETIDVEAGETVTLRVTNTGVITHDLLLAMHEDQLAHEAEMQSDPAMAHGPNGFVLAPGETRDLVWKFTAPGQAEIGCHVPGHYDAGMVGQIRVN